MTALLLAPEMSLALEGVIDQEKAGSSKVESVTVEKVTGAPVQTGSGIRSVGDPWPTAVADSRVKKINL